MEMKIVMKKGIEAYQSAIEHFLVGADDQHPVDVVSITALEGAIGRAVLVAMYAQEKGWGTIVKVHTDYLQQSSDSSRCHAHLTIDVERQAALKKAHNEDLANFKKDHVDLCAAMKHTDHIERAKCILLGALAYGAKAKAEIFEMDCLLAEKPGQSVLPRERMRKCVKKLKGIMGQSALSDNIHTSTDPQTLLLMQCHWLEATDEKHRYGNNLVEYYYIWKDSDTHDSFFYWLDYGEGKDLSLDVCPRSDLDMGMIKYLTIIEREQYRVAPKDGKLCYLQSGEAVDGEKIFVMGSHQHELYMGTKVKLRFQHSSFLAGGCVACAGSAVLDAGEFTGFSGSSGHYRPKKEDFKLFTQTLQEQGLSEKIFEVPSRHNRRPWFLSEGKAFQKHVIETQGPRLEFPHSRGAGNVVSASSL